VFTVCVCTVCMLTVCYGTYHHHGPGSVASVRMSLQLRVGFVSCNAFMLLSDVIDFLGDIHESVHKSPVMIDHNVINDDIRVHS
jgi:hypothetical protein